MNIQGFCSSLLECESFLKSNSTNILALCQANLDDSIDYDNFSVSGYLTLIRKDSVTHMHGIWKDVFCTGLISRKLRRFLLMFSTGFTSLSVLLLFPLLSTFFLFIYDF